jgi:hypothetical protein
MDVLREGGMVKTFMEGEGGRLGGGLAATSFGMAGRERYGRFLGRSEGPVGGGGGSFPISLTGLLYFSLFLSFRGNGPVLASLRFLEGHGRFSLSHAET